MSPKFLIGSKQGLIFDLIIRSHCIASSAVGFWYFLVGSKIMPDREKDGKRERYKQKEKERSGRVMWLDRQVRQKEGRRDGVREDTLKKREKERRSSVISGRDREKGEATKRERER